MLMTILESVSDGYHEMSPNSESVTELLVVVTLMLVMDFEASLRRWSQVLRC